MAPGLLLPVLGVLALLQVKHSVIDGPLQLKWMLRDKGDYGKPGGLVHAGLHGTGTLLVFALCGYPPATAILLGAADTALHYHIDFTKESIVKSARWTPERPQFWWALTTDQLLHQLTYLVLTGIAVSELPLMIWS